MQVYLKKKIKLVSTQVAENTGALALSLSLSSCTSGRMKQGPLHLANANTKLSPTREPHTTRWPRFVSDAQIRRLASAVNVQERLL